MKIKNSNGLAALLVVILCSCANVNGQDVIADNMLLFQRNYGGWPKHFEEKAINYSREYTVAEKASITDDNGRNDATIDNNATTKEIWYLINAYKQFNNPKYLAAAENGIRYLLKAQYKNGGWPQYYPDVSSYRSEITYNDNAMTNVLKLMQDVVLKRNNLELVDASLITPASDAIKKGIDCILKTQVKVKGYPTVWCAQYDATTMQPAKARSFELISLSGSESVAIVEFLMAQPNPSKAIKDAINCAIGWFEKSKIVGYNFIEIKDAAMPKGVDKILVEDKNTTIWARFYDIDTNEPFFCGRDSKKKKTVKEIEHERRNGYAWYGNWPEKILTKTYPKWLEINK